MEGITIYGAETAQAESDTDTVAVITIYGVVVALQEVAGGTLTDFVLSSLNLEVPASLWNSSIATHHRRLHNN